MNQDLFLGKRDMHPDTLFILLFIEICIFVFTAISFVLVIAYYHALKVENKKEIWSKIVVSVFKREAAPEFDELTEITNRLYKNFSQYMSILLKVALSLFAMNAAMILLIVVSLAFIPNKYRIG